MDLFLQILWTGRITVATGQTFQLQHYYVGFATNLGGAEAMRMKHSTFASIEQAVQRRFRQTLRSKFLARLDEVLVFAHLGSDAQRQICDLLVKREESRLRGLGHDLVISREAMEFLVREGFDPHLGARPLRRAVERHLQEAVVQSLFARGSVSGDVVVEPFQRRSLQVQVHDGQFRSASSGGGN